MNNDKKMKISFYINMVITILMINAIIMSIMGIKFMYGYEPAEDIVGVPIFSYFTIQSNIFIGIVSFIFANKEYEIFKGKKKEIPKFYYILKMVATVSVSLTFFIVFAYLGFITKGGHLPLLRNTNLFFHLVIPVLSIINYLIFEKNDCIKFRYTIYGIIPTIFYEIYYGINLLVGMKDGKVPLTNDWYYFAQNGIINILIAVPSMIIVTYLLTLVIWRINKKI